MRFGCCGSLVAQNPDKTGVEIVEKIAQYGYDYIELPLAEMMQLSDADFAALCKRVERSGIRCEACNNFFPGRIRLTGRAGHPCLLRQSAGARRHSGREVHRVRQCRCQAGAGGLRY